MSQFFKALADNTRLRLVHILFKYELSVNELVQLLKIGQSRVSRHLKILAEAGLLRSRRDGLWVFYSVPPAGNAHNFLNAIMPFIPQTRQYSEDLELAAKAIEDRSKRTTQFFNVIADDWDSLNHEILGDFDLGNRVLAAMPKNCQVAVDLGCGTGEILEKMLLNAATVIGVDGSARMLDLSRNRLGAIDKDNSAISLRIGELSHLPLADQEANFACINLVLHHLASPSKIFPEIRRIMKPGGKFFLADFHAHEDESMRNRYGDHWLGFNCKELCADLENAGFHLQSVESAPIKKDLQLFLITATI